MKETNYEWGFKMVPVTAADKTLRWNKRLKAVGAFVPTQFVDEAKYSLSELLLQEDVIQDSNQYQDRYTFMPPQESLGEDEDVLLTYNSFVARQRAHINALHAKDSYHLAVPIDQHLITRANQNISLREIILSIKVRDQNSPFYTMNLFHSVDFSPDTSKVWLGTKTGPGGPGYVFTFYKPVKREAEQMVQGLGRYVARVYGSDMAKQAFTKQHWRSTRGWKYFHTRGTFERPDEKHMKSNLAYDKNLLAFRCLQNLEMLEPESKQPQSHSSQTQPSSTSKRSKKNKNSAGTTTSSSATRYSDVESLLDDPSVRSLGTIEESEKEDESSDSSFTRKAMDDEMELVERIRGGVDIATQQQKLLDPTKAIQQVKVTDSPSVTSSLTEHSFDDKSLSSIESSTPGSITSKATKRSDRSYRLSEHILAELVEESMDYNGALK